MSRVPSHRIKNSATYSPEYTVPLRCVLSCVLTVNVVLSLQGSLAKMNDLGIMYRHAYSVTAVEEVKAAEQVERED